MKAGEVWRKKRDPTTRLEIIDYAGPDCWLVKKYIIGVKPFEDMESGEVIYKYWEKIQKIK